MMELNFFYVELFKKELLVVLFLSARISWKLGYFLPEKTESKKLGDVLGKGRLDFYS